MDTLEQIKEAVKNYLKSNHQHDVSSESLQLEPTRREFEGDFTLVVFPFVKAMRTRPEDAAAQIGEHLVSQLELVESFNVIKGFLNISLAASFWSQALNERTSSKDWLQANSPSDLILVEYSSPNTNKPLHLGHLRNIFLGYSISKIHAFEGKEVVKTQIINDRGVHICKSMLAWSTEGKGETPLNSGLKGDKLVGKYYVLYDSMYRAEVSELMAKGMPEEEAKKEAPLQKAVQQMLLRWEKGEADTIELWKKMNGWVYAGFDQTYERMGVEFDRVYHESETYSKGKDIVLNGLKKGVFIKKDDGSIWADLSAEGLDDKLLVRADGTTVYMTQDIGTAVQRFEDFPDLKQVIYTVGDEQDYHFKVLFIILEKLGYTWAKSCKHLSYGMVDLPSGKMKSREGTVVDADDLMEEVVEAARSSSEEKGKLDEMSESEQNALFETLGVGALKFYLLRVDPKKRMLFDPMESVSLSGDTGPFVQYTYARCKAVLRKAGDIGNVNALASVQDKERALLTLLLSFRKITSAAATELNPSLIANFCLDLAKLYNQFYHEFPILKADGDVRAFRLGLTEITAETLKAAMGLLNIDVPNRM